MPTNENVLLLAWASGLFLLASATSKRRLRPFLQWFAWLTMACLLLRACWQAWRG